MKKLLSTFFLALVLTFSMAGGVALTQTSEPAVTTVSAKSKKKTKKKTTKKKAKKTTKKKKTKKKKSTSKSKGCFSDSSKDFY
jgi:Ni/Co efflux regulator RcnB